MTAPRLDHQSGGGVGAPLILRPSTLIDGIADVAHTDREVIVEDGMIASVATQASHAPSAIDLSGVTILPGLIDAHTHLGLSSDIAERMAGNISDLEHAAAIFRACADALDAGVTTVRDVGGVDDGLVRAIGTGLVPGPRVVPSGPILCQRGGHGHLAAPFASDVAWMLQDRPGLATLSLVCDGPDEVRKAAREAFRRGARFIKMCVTGGVISAHDNLTDTQFTLAEVRAAVEEAEARGSYVTVHAHNVAGIRRAIEAGARVVEHGTDLDPGTAKVMAQRGVHLVPTLSIVHELVRDPVSAGLPASVKQRAEGVEAGMVAAIRNAMAAGLVIGSGSDLIGPDQTDRCREVWLKAAVMGTMEALKSATSINARILGLEGQIGAIEPGLTADVIGVVGDPLENPEVFRDARNIVLVVQRGRIVKNTVADAR